MDQEEMFDFVSQYINKLPYKQKEEILQILISKIPTNLIDSSNNDGTRIYKSDIPEDVMKTIYTKVKSYLE